MGNTKIKIFPHYFKTSTMSIIIEEVEIMNKLLDEYLTKNPKYSVKSTDMEISHSDHGSIRWMLLTVVFET